MLINTKSRHGQTTFSIQDSQNFSSDDVTIAGYFREFRQFWIGAMSAGYLSYFFFGFGLHVIPANFLQACRQSKRNNIECFFFSFYTQWFYFVMQKDDPSKWKSQPSRWLPRELEIDEIITGSLALFVVNTWSAAFAYYLNWGGYTMLYSRWDEYGITWWFLQFAVLFIITVNLFVISAVRST